MAGVRTNARWIRDFVAYDPAPALDRITVPVLAVTGGQDLQVPPEDVDTIGRLVKGPSKVTSSAISVICSGPILTR